MYLTNETMNEILDKVNSIAYSYLYCGNDKQTRRKLEQEINGYFQTLFHLKIITTNELRCILFVDPDKQAELIIGFRHGKTDIILEKFLRNHSLGFK